MATWSEISRDNLAAAGELMRSGRYRSGVSRAYYAAFAAVAQALVAKKLRFVEGRAAPSHAKLRRTAERNMGRLSLRERSRLLSLLNELYERRLAADYQPGATIAEPEARESLNAAASVLGLVGVST